MILDNLNIFSDSQAITATADSTNKVNIGLVNVGKGDPLIFKVKVTEAFNNLTSLKAELFQCDTESGSYTAVPGANSTVLLAGLTVGADFGFRFLPRGVTKPWLKVTYTVTGTAPTTGKVFAALLREEQDSYEAGQYIDKGVTVG